VQRKDRPKSARAITLTFATTQLLVHILLDLDADRVLN
jgi:hypothetical protein